MYIYIYVFFDKQTIGELFSLITQNLKKNFWLTSFVCRHQAEERFRVSIKISWAAYTTALPSTTFPLKSEERKLRFLTVTTVHSNSLDLHLFAKMLTATNAYWIETYFK